MVDFNVIISTITIGGAFMLGLLLFTAQFKNKKGNIFLGLFLWNLAYLELEDSFLLNLDYNFDGTQFILVFLLFYLIITINRPFKKWYLLLLLPGIIANIIEFTSNINHEELEFHYIDLFKVFYIVELFLLIYFLKILRSHKIKANEFYTNMELKTLSWLKGLVFLILLLHIVFIFEDVILPDSIFSRRIPAIIIFLIVYWIGCNGLSQPEIFKGGFNPIVDKENSNTPNLEITEKEFNTMKGKILSKRLYAKQNLTLRDLSLSLNMKEKEVSNLIKLHSGTTFYHFINRFRIEEFKDSMKSSKSEKLSVFGLAQEVGFVSKSTFYAAFKAVEGKTPKQYESTLKEFD